MSNGDFAGQLADYVRMRTKHLNPDNRIDILMLLKDALDEMITEVSNDSFDTEADHP